MKIFKREELHIIDGGKITPAEVLEGLGLLTSDNTWHLAPEPRRPISNAINKVRQVLRGGQPRQ